MIDSHHHVWRLDRPERVWPTAAEAVLFRNHEIAEYRALADAAGVTASVLVQTQESADDTDWLLDLAADDPRLLGVVGWIDFAGANVAEAVRASSRRPGLLGLRPMVQSRPSDWYDDPAFAGSAGAMMDTGLRLDALVRVTHLASLNRLATRFPELRIVVDHAAKPEIGAPEGYKQWHAEIAPLAELPNVSCKLSGLLTECPEGRRTADVLAPYVSDLLDLFGPDRLMWGSDWPVLNAASDFETWLGMARMLVPAGAHEAVFGGTAARFYGVAAEGAAHG